MLGRPRPTTPLPIQRPPSSGAFTPAHCVPVFPVGQPTPGLARPSCLVCPAVPAIRLPGGCTGTPVMKVRLRRHLPRQRSGQVPLPVGSAPHNPDHSRQRVGIGQPGADGPAATSGLDSSHRAFHRLPFQSKPKPTPQNPIEFAASGTPAYGGRNVRLGRSVVGGEHPPGEVRLRRTKEKPGVSLIYRTSTPY